MKFWLLMLGLLCMASPSYALCVAPSMTVWPSTVTYSQGGNGYDPYDSNRYLQTASITIAEVAGVDCQYYFVLSAGGSGNAGARTASLGGQSLAYRMFTDSNGTQNWAASGSHGQSQVIYGSLTSLLTTRTHNFYWDVTPLQVRGRSVSPYVDTVQITLHARYALGWNSSTVGTMTVNIPVKSSVDVSVGNMAGFDILRTSHIVDLGVLENGVSENFITTVRSNDGHIVRLSSTNSQKLKHDDLANTIDYSLSFDGSNVDLSSGNMVVVKNAGGTTSATGQSYTSTITIQNMNYLEPIGVYRDIINMDVSAQ